MTNVEQKTTSHKNESSISGLLFASLATAVAGFLDAVGYSQLDHLYVSFMSGNSTHFGMSLAAGQWSQAASAVYIIAIFVIGTFLGTIILDASPRPLLAILVGEIAFCCAAMVMANAGIAATALVLTALMMGMQNVVHQNVGGTDAGKGFITGALFGLGQALARVASGAGGLAKAAVYASTWLSFIIGVVGGGISILGLGVLPSLGIVLGGLFLLAAMALSKSFTHVSAGS